MNIKSISFFLSLFCFPISLLALINILYSSYFDYFLSIEAYFATLVLSLVFGLLFYFFGKQTNKKINFIEQLILVVLVYFVIGFLTFVVWVFPPSHPAIDAFRECSEGVRNSCGVR